MKAFSSSILSVKQTPITESVTGTFDSFETSKSTLIKFLEFNEAAAEADIRSTRDYYLNVLNVIRSGSGNYDPALNACFTQYEAVKNAAMSCMGPGDCVEPEARPVSDAVAILEKLKKTNPSDTLTQVYASTTMANVEDVSASFIFEQYCKDVIAGKDMKGANLPEAVVNYIGKCAGLDGAESIEELMDKITNSYSIQEREIPISNYSFYESFSNQHIWIYPLALTKSADLAISYLKVNADKYEDPNDVREIVKNICDAISTYAIIVLKASQIAEDINNKVRTEDIKHIMEFASSHGMLSESMSMFGDEIDSKSVFDDLEPGDFNPTEFMNLELVSEHAMKMDSMETYKWAMSMEAKYLAEQNYQGLVDLNEAVGQKIKAGLQKALEALKKIAAKFVEAILFNFGTEKAWLTKYKNIILNNTLKADTQITVFCNLQNAVNLITEVNAPTINYAELTKDGTDAFESEEKFFEYKFKNVFEASSKAPHVPKDASIADRVKYTLGAKYPNGESDAGTIANFGGNAVQNGVNWPSVAKMYQWLLDTEKLARNTQAQIKNIERTVDNYTKSAEKLGAPENQQNNAQNNNQQQSNNTQQNGGTQTQNNNQNQAKQESYYSYIYNKYLTEMDIKSAPANDGGQGGTSDPNPKEAYKTTQGDTDEQVKNSKDAGSVITGRMNIYMNVCKQVLTAKMTAINYAHKEMLDLMRAIVKGRLGDSADIELKPQNGNNNGNQQQNQEQPVEKPSATQGAAPNQRRGLFRRR